MKDIKDWTETEHDQSLHRGFPLNRTGLVEGCPRCDLLKSDDPVKQEINYKTRISQLEAEVALAKERLGPAGYKVLERVKQLEAENLGMREIIKQASQARFGYEFDINEVLYQNAYTERLVKKIQTLEEVLFQAGNLIKPCDGCGNPQGHIADIECPYRIKTSLFLKAIQDAKDAQKEFEKNEDHF